MLTKHKIIEAMEANGQGEPPKDIEGLIRIVVNDPSTVCKETDDGSQLTFSDSDQDMERQANRGDG